MSTEIRDDVLACAKALADHNGGATLVMDLSGISSWTDYFIVTTATSTAHMRGLLRHLDDQLGELGMSALRRPHLADDEEWCLVDVGDFVVHIMSSGARSFYELEKLWFEAGITPISGGAPGEPEVS